MATARSELDLTPRSHGAGWLSAWSRDSHAADCLIRQFATEFWSATKWAWVPPRVVSLPASCQVCPRLGPRLHEWSGHAVVTALCGKRSGFSPFCGHASTYGKSGLDGSGSVRRRSRSACALSPRVRATGFFRSPTLSIRVLGTYVKCRAAGLCCTPNANLAARRELDDPPYAAAAPPFCRCRQGGHRNRSG